MKERPTVDTSPPPLRWAGTVGLLLSAVILFFAPWAVQDFQRDWLVTSASFAGFDPYQPVTSLASDVGLDLSGGIHPRLPGAIVLQAWMTLVPQAWVVPAGRIFLLMGIVVAALALAQLGERSPYLLLALSPVYLVSLPGLTVASFGSPSLYVAAALAAAWSLLRRRGDSWLAGGLLGVATVLKLWPVFLIVLLLLKRRWRAVGGWFVAVATLNLGGMILLDITLAEVIRMLTAATGYLPHSWNGSLVPLEPWGAWIAALVAIAFLGAASRMPLDRAVALGIPVALLTAPIAWPMYLTSTLVPLMTISPRIAIVGLLPWFAYLLPGVSHGTVTMVSATVAFIAIAVSTRSPERVKWHGAESAMARRQAAM